MKQLEGKKITKILMNDDNTLVRFVDGEGKNYDFLAEGDCCSYSWVEHMANVSALLNQTILEVEEIDLSDLNVTCHPEHDYLQVYGWKFKSSGGIMDLEFRNASNGYYGGSMEYIEKGFESFTVFKNGHEKIEDFKSVTEDF